MTAETAAPPRVRTFYIVWFGQLISMLGSELTGFGIAIWTYRETGSVTQLSLVMLAVAVPGILLAPVAGASVDRLDRRMVMLTSDAIAGATTLFLVSMIWADALQFWQILAAIGLASAARAFQEPAYLASIPTLVPKDRLGRANGLVELGPAIGTLVAPALAGVLLFTAGLWSILLIDAATFMAAVATLAIVRFTPVDKAEEHDTPLRQRAAAGFRYLRNRPGMMRLIFMMAGLNVAFAFASVLYTPLFLSFTNEAILGMVISLAGVGMVAGSLVMSAWGGPQRRVRGVITMVVGMGLALSLAGLRPSLLLAAIAAVVLFFILPLVNGTSQALWQVKVELDMQGRVFSTRRMLALFATPIAYIVAGPLADGLLEPAMADGGSLSGALGPIFSVGEGRGIGLLFFLVGAATIMIALVAWSDPRIRNLERDYPDVLVEETEGGPQIPQDLVIAEEADPATA